MFLGGAPEKRGSLGRHPANQPTGSQVPSDDHKPSPGFAHGSAGSFSGNRPSLGKMPHLATGPGP